MSRDYNFSITITRSILIYSYCVPGNLKTSCGVLVCVSSCLHTTRTCNICNININMTIKRLYSTVLYTCGSFVLFSTITYWVGTLAPMYCTRECGVVFINILIYTVYNLIFNMYFVIRYVLYPVCVSVCVFLLPFAGRWEILKFSESKPCSL